MLSGTQVIGSFDQALIQAQSDAAVLDREVNALTERMLKLREAEAEAYQQLAHLRLGTMADERAGGAPTEADQRVRTLMAQRAELAAAIDRELAAIDAEAEPLIARRAEAAAKVERIEESLQAANGKVREHLEQTEAYQSQLAAAQKADQVARHAEQKTTLAEQDRTGKGKPYEDDPLFLYLWRRGYGTAAYEGGAIAQFFDRRVARLIDFDAARANYAMLQEIPQRLAEHAARRRAEAEEQARRLRAIEDEALQVPEVSAARQALQQAQQLLDADDDAVEAVQAKRAAELEKRAALTRGDDEVTRQAAGIVEAALRREDLKVLREQARRTPLPDDDAVVVRLEGIEAEIARTLAQLQDQTNSAGAAKATDGRTRTNAARLSAARRGRHRLRLRQQRRFVRAARRDAARRPLGRRFPRPDEPPSPPADGRTVRRRWLGRRWLAVAVAAAAAVAVAVRAAVASAPAVVFRRLPVRKPPRR